VEWQAKAQLVYQLPAGFLVSGSFSYRSGAHLIRRLRLSSDVTGIPVDNTNVLILQPRGENGRIESVTFLDARIQKDFAARRSSSRVRRRAQPAQRAPRSRGERS
jgi:hypothetical protein